MNTIEDFTWPLNSKSGLTSYLMTKILTDVNNLQPACMGRSESLKDSRNRFECKTWDTEQLADIRKSIKTTIENLSSVYDFPPKTTL